MPDSPIREGRSGRFARCDFLRTLGRSLTNGAFQARSWTLNENWRRRVQWGVDLHAPEAIILIASHKPMIIGLLGLQQTLECYITLC